MYFVFHSLDVITLNFSLFCRCEHCGREFRYPFKKKQHMRVHAGYRCEQCTEVHETWSALRRHVAFEHRARHTSPSSNRRRPAAPRPAPVPSVSAIDPFVSSLGLLARLLHPPTPAETFRQLALLHASLLTSRARVALAARHRCPAPGCACLYLHARSLRLHLLRRHSALSPATAGVAEPSELTRAASSSGTDDAALPSAALPSIETQIPCAPAESIGESLTPPEGFVECQTPTESITEPVFSSCVARPASPQAALVP